MSGNTIRTTKAIDFFLDPRAEPLIKEYAEESALAGLPPPKPDIPLYVQMEKMGLYHGLCAFSEAEDLIGFAGVIISPNPHYSALIGSMETLFVGKAYRSGGAGIGLIREARRIAKEAGAVGLFSAAATGSRLEAVYDKMDCTRTHQVYFWGFA